MKYTLLSTSILSVSLFGSAIADTTFGVGVGSLYNGLGLYFGQTNNTSLMFGSLGCIGASSSRSGNATDGFTTRDRSYETNCGVGLGYINMLLWPGNKHGLGLSIGYTYDTNDISGGSEYHVMPGYHYFLNGISQRGLNIGFGAKVTRSEIDSADTDLIFNLGYQF